MKWIKRLLKGIAALLVLLLLAAVGFREWCVWRLPRMRREVNEAWRDYAGVALDDVPKAFPAVETNEAALNLEKAAAKLGICLAPKTYKQRCPRNAPTQAAVADYEALSFKNEKGEEKSFLTDYLNKQMERPSPVEDTQPPQKPTEKAISYIETHRDGLNEIQKILLGNELPRWSFQPVDHYIVESDNSLGHFALFKIMAMDALGWQERRRSVENEARINALDRLLESRSTRPNTVTVLISVAEERVLSSLVRKLKLTGISPGIHATKNDWMIALRSEAIYFAWRTTTSVAQEYSETHEYNMDDLSELEPKEKKRKYSDRFMRPWSQLSMLQMNMATIHDMKFYDSQDRCHPNALIPGVSFQKEAWYKPKWYYAWTIVSHPELSWWNPIGKIVYGIGRPYAGTWNRIFRIQLENEMTRKVMMIRAANRDGKGWPAAIPGIESSVCRGESWKYSLSREGFPILAFSGKPDWGTLKGAKVPLWWTENPNPPKAIFPPPASK